MVALRVALPTVEAVGDEFEDEAVAGAEVLAALELPLLSEPEAVLVTVTVVDEEPVAGPMGTGRTTVAEDAAEGELCA